MKPRFLGTPSSTLPSEWVPGLQPFRPPTALPTAFPLPDAGWLVHEDTGFQRRLPSGGISSTRRVRLLPGPPAGVTLGPGQDWMDPHPEPRGRESGSSHQPLPQGLGLSWEEPGFLQP